MLNHCVNYSIPPKNGSLAPKPPNLAQNWHFWPIMGLFGPFDLMPDQKTIETSCLGGFSVMWVTKLLLTPVKNLARHLYTLCYLSHIAILHI